MTASRTWTPATPATYDAGDGAMIHVSESGPYIRRQRRSYCGRGGDWTTYTHDPRDQGGPRPGAGPGRPKVAPGEPTVTIQSKASASQRDKFLALGGSEWLRRQIDRAKVPK